jgi:hypothetical protein
VGGQSDGTWTRTIKDSKIYWVDTNGGTEGDNWGEVLTLPMNVTGDIIIDANIRSKTYSPGPTYGGIGVGVNWTAGLGPRNGCSLWHWAGSIRKWAFIAGATPNLPGFPGRGSYVATADLDLVSNIRIVRTNGYIRLFMDNMYYAQAAFAATITGVSILFSSYKAFSVDTKRWIDYIQITPREVVTGGP